MQWDSERKQPETSKQKERQVSAGKKKLFKALPNFEFPAPSLL